MAEGWLVEGETAGARAGAVVEVVRALATLGWAVAGVCGHHTMLAAPPRRKSPEGAVGEVKSPHLPGCAGEAEASSHKGCGSRPLTGSHREGYEGAWCAILHFT